MPIIKKLTVGISLLPAYLVLCPKKFSAFLELISKSSLLEFQVTQRKFVSQLVIMKSASVCFLATFLFLSAMLLVL